MLRIFASALAVALLSSTAHAANWTGFYLGAFGGHVWGDYEFDYNPPDVGSSTDGWLAGGEIGGNFQTGSVVFGGEADLAWTSIDGSNSCPNAAFDCDSEIDWIGTARGRLGMAAGQFLFFGTGGLAYGEVTGETVFLPGGGIPPSGTPVNGEDNILFGWTAGAGIEGQIGPPTNRWTIKGDWLLRYWRRKLRHRQRPHGRRRPHRQYGQAAFDQALPLARPLHSTLLQQLV